jgi:nicotinate (nicotinamide) nucleotide adenylyltransferase/ribosome silencing factor RsfS/YbeB/iojap
MRIGVFGGSFDPVHEGHMAIAESALAEASLDLLLFMPVHIQPFKRDAAMSGAVHRLAMLRLAAAGDGRFAVTDVELENRGVSYTLNSLREIRRGFPEGAEVFFLLGADMLLMLEKWYHAEELLREFSFIAGLRPGSEDADAARSAERLRRVYGARILLMKNRRLDISSSDIRRRIEAGERGIDGLPPAVEAYIRENGLYGRPAPVNIADALNELRGRLSAKRFAHAEGVMRTASRLAAVHGEDAEKAETAALFHDWFREETNGEMNRLIDCYALDPGLKDKPDIAHGPLAAAYMRDRRGIEDEDVLNAVRCHTTGRAGMSGLEKILYLADAVEPSRDYPGADALRKLAEEDLDAACAAALENSLRHLRETGAIPDERSAEALAWLRENREGQSAKQEKEDSLLDNRELALAAAGVLNEKKGTDIVVIDISGQSSFADYFVIASGSSARQAGSLTDEVRDRLEKKGAVPGHIEGKPDSGWILLDYGDVIVNIFTKEMRDLYQIEQIWGDGDFLDLVGITE